VTEHTDVVVAGWERHTGTVIASAAVALMGWNFVTVSTMAQDLAGIKVQILESTRDRESIRRIYDNQIDMDKRIHINSSRINAVIKAQDREDVRERKEHGGLL